MRLIFLIKKYTLEEFYALTEDTRAELIDGQIYYLASLIEIHQIIVGEVYAEIRSYIKQNKGKCRAFVAPFDVKLSEDIVQPDVFVLCDKSKRNEKHCIGAPDWIIEVTSSNDSHDYVKKLKLYIESGVREYWIIYPKHERIIIYTTEHRMSLCRIYRFTDTITVGIYKDNPEPLQICVADLISDY